MILVNFFFWFFVLVVIWLGISTDHFWTRQPYFVHYTDLTFYWLGLFSRRCRSETFLGRPMITSKEAMERILDESVDWLEEKFGITEENIFLQEGKLFFSLPDEEPAFAEFLPVELFFQEKRSLAHFVTKIHSGSFQEIHLRKHFLPLLTGLLGTPILFAAPSSQVPNVVPLLSFRRTIFRNHQQAATTAATLAPTNDFMYKKSRRNAVMKINYQCSLFAYLLDERVFPPLDRAVIADIASSFEVTAIYTKSPVSSGMYRSFLSKHVESPLSILCDENEFCYTYGIVGSVSRELMATCTLQFRQEEGLMQMTSLVFDERTRGGKEGSGGLWQRSEQVWSAVKSAWVVMMLQQLQLFAEESLIEACKSAWIVDGLSSGLQFFQERAVALLPLGFQTNELPMIDFQADQQGEIALFVSNVYLPLQQRSVFTNVAW